MTLDRAGPAGDSAIFFAAVSSARMPMLVTDPTQPDNPVVFVNAPCCELTGYGAHEMLGRNVRFLQGRDTDPASVALVREAVADGRDVAVELLNYRQDGSAFWNALFISPVRSPDGTLRYFFASQLDVTRRREAERALAQAQHLEGMGALAGGMAHAFNNLLTVIGGNLEPLIRDLSGEARAAVRLGRVREAAERAAALTVSMVAFARRQLLDAEVVDLKPLLARLAPGIQSAVAPNAVLRLEIADAPCLIRADAEQLRLALTNLVRNASEANPRSGKVVVRVGPGTDTGAAEIGIAVRDDGAGMSREVARRAVDPFFTTRRPGTGVGLGLSMAYGFTRQSGGRLEIDSHVGEGTTVRMTFPAA